MRHLRNCYFIHFQDAVFPENNVDLTINNEFKLLLLKRRVCYAYN